MMAVAVGTDAELTLGTPRILFEKPLLESQYDVAADGERFLMVDSSESVPRVAELHLVQNWDLKQ
jgi:hypothetical protein